MLCRFGHPELSWQDVQVALAPAAHEYSYGPLLETTPLHETDRDCAGSCTT